MNAIRQFLFTGLIVTMASAAGASVTKVGNGDDGADLESLSQITSGPIVDAKKSALETLKRLNVTGLPGLGLLTPELENSKLLLAGIDVHSTGEPAGSLEVSADGNIVYARTFAEPYAATRFFPSALKLSQEQLTALHIHEALHRSLPASIRSSENAVMHITMAMTSPGASFDRVRQVTGIYVPFGAPSVEEMLQDIRGTSNAGSLATQVPVVHLPERTRTDMTLLAQIVTSSYRPSAPMRSEQLVGGLDFSTSLGGYRNIKGFAVEPMFKASIRQSDASNLGPSSLTLGLRTRIDEAQTLLPFVRMSLRSLDDTTIIKNDRDLSTVGLKYANEDQVSYIHSELAYSFANSTEQMGLTSKYGSILSITNRLGLKFGRFYVGAVGDIHFSEGVETPIFPENSYDDYGNYVPRFFKLDSFRILAGGLELGFSNERFDARLSVKKVLNSTAASLTDLADFVDRGAGNGGLTTSFAMKF